MLEPGKTVSEGWTRVDIVEKVPAHEEAVYSDERIGRYLIRVEIEPIMVSKNTLFRTIQGMPLYVVRWVPKITWGEIREDVEKK